MQALNTNEIEIVSGGLFMATQITRALPTGPFIAGPVRGQPEPLDDPVIFNGMPAFARL